MSADHALPPLADASTTRLSLILSGAVSLGAYEGGVVAQLAYALARWNEARPEAPPRAVIDVIAGASAGAMTGAMLAHHLMTGDDPREFVSRVRESWCGASTTLPEMLRPRSGDEHSFLSSRLIDDVAEKFFQPREGDPARVRQAEVVFTCTLTSLEAIPYQFQMLTRRRLKPMPAWTRRDWATFSVLRGDQPGAPPPVWELPTGCRAGQPESRRVDWPRLVSFGLASGAFPVAFQPIAISRLTTDYPKPLRDTRGWVRLRYMDGGVLDNMPFKRASEALGSLHERGPMGQRLYLLLEVEPYRYRADRLPVEDAGPDAAPIPSHGRSGAPVPGVLSAGFVALRQQSFYQDLSDTQKLNRRLGMRDRFLLPALKEAAAQVADVGAAEEEAREQLAGLLEEKYFTGGPPTVEEELERYRAAAPGSRLGALLEALDPERRDLLLLQAALVDHATGLAGKHTIRVERIHPRDPSALAGEHLGAFGGFLDPSLTRHDFLLGLGDAYCWLKEWAQARGWEPPAPVDWLPREPRGEGLSRRELKDFPHGMLEPASDLALRRTLDFLGEELPWLGLLTSGLPGWILERFLDYRLRLGSTDEALPAGTDEPFDPRSHACAEETVAPPGRSPAPAGTEEGSDQESGNETT